jgi:hypothetical protein
MKTFLVFSILLLSMIAVTTITTTVQIQPAYSQASHCTEVFGTSTCVTPGQNPTIQTDGSPPRPIGGDNPHQEAGRQIMGCHSTAAQIPGLVECTVTHP